MNRQRHLCFCFEVVFLGALDRSRERPTRQKRLVGMLHLDPTQGFVQSAQIEAGHGHLLKASKGVSFSERKLAPFLNSSFVLPSSDISNI